MRWLLLFVVLGVACSGGKSAQSGSGQPTEDASAPRDPELVGYRFVLEPGDVPKLVGELEVQGEEDGTTDLGVYDSWAMLAKIHKSVKNPQAVGEDGRALQLGEMAMQQDTIAYWSVTHEPNEVIRFRWEIANESDVHRKSTRYFNGPVVRDDVVHFLGHFIVFPVMLPPRESNVKVELALEGLQAVSSFHAAGRGFERRMRVDHLRNAVFYAAKELRVHERMVGENPVHLAITGQYRFEDAELADLLQKVVQGQRDIFADHTVPQFLVTVLPNNQHVNPETPEAAQTGLGFHNSFAAFVRPTASLSSPAAAYELKNLFAHEMLHHWVSARIYLTPGPSSYSWFTEGVTTYLAGELMREKGVLGDKQYLEHVNAYCVGYQKSPLRTATNEQAAEAFWKGNDGHEIAYNRGAVLTAFLNRELRSVSNGTRSVTDLLADMLKQAAADGPLDEAKLWKLIEAQTSAEFAKWFRERAMNGLDIDLAPDLFGDGYTSVQGKDDVVTYLEKKTK